MKIKVCIIVVTFLVACGDKKPPQQPTEAEAKLSVQLVEDSEKLWQGSHEWFAILDSAIALNPYNASAYREKSVWFTKTGDYVNALDLLNKAVDLDPYDAVGYRGWLKLYYFHDYEGAVEDLNHFNSLSPETAFAWGENVFFLTGLAKKELRRYNDAIEDFSKYIDETTADVGEDWVDPYAFIYRGICFSKEKNYPKAIEDFERAILYCQTCPEAYWQLGLSYIDMGLIERGCASIDSAMRYSKYIKSDPYNMLFDQPSHQLMITASKKYCN